MNNKSLHIAIESMELAMTIKGKTGDEGYVTVRQDGFVGLDDISYSSTDELEVMIMVAEMFNAWKKNQLKKVK